MKFGRLPGVKRTTPAKGVKARARHEPGVMNGAEMRYSQLLEAQKRQGQIVDWRFEPLKLRLAKKTFFTPDFLVVRLDCELELVDVKGSGPEEEDARVKVKVAAEQFGMFHFVVARERTRKAGGGFALERLGATVAPANSEFTIVKEDKDVGADQKALRKDRLNGRH